MRPGEFPGTTVASTAAAGTNSVFDHWEGGASGTANPVNVVVNGNTAVRAVFVPRFTVTVAVEGSGSVDPDGGTFDGGSQINLTATPSGQDVYFIEWQGDLTGPTTPPRQGTVRCARRDVVSTSTAWASM